MTFSRANLTGWSLGDQFTPTQANALDLDHSRAIDGYAGGTYTPSGAIVINGDFSCTQWGTSEFTFINTADAAISIAASTAATGRDLYFFAGQGDPGSGSVIIGSGSTPLLTVSPTDGLTLSSPSSITRVLNGMVMYDQAAWTGIYSTGGIALATGGVDFVCGIGQIPHGATITAITLYVKGAGGHAALPATMPKFQLISTTMAGSDSVLTTATDASATKEAYELDHTITKTGVSLTLDWTQYAYRISISNEGDANSVAGFRYNYGTVTFSMPAAVGIP